MTGSDQAIQVNYGALESNGCNTKMSSSTDRKKINRISRILGRNFNSSCMMCKLLTCIWLLTVSAPEAKLWCWGSGQICVQPKVTEIHAKRERRNLPVSHGSKYHRPHQQAKHIDGWTKTVQSSFVTHKVPLRKENTKRKGGIKILLMSVAQPYLKGNISI